MTWESSLSRRLYVRLPGTPETWVDGQDVASVSKVGEGIFIVTLECGAEHETEVDDSTFTAEGYLRQVLDAMHSRRIS